MVTRNRCAVVRAFDAERARFSAVAGVAEGARPELCIAEGAQCRFYLRFFLLCRFQAVCFFAKPYFLDRKVVRFDPDRDLLFPLSFFYQKCVAAGPGHVFNRNECAVAAVILPEHGKTFLLEPEVGR